MTKPTIHLNGTSAEDLLQGYRDAAAAVADATTAIGKIEFNARDYYPVEGSWQSARAEMDARLRALAALHAELMEIAIHCSDAVAERESRRARHGN